jgi:pimeloyl-ACP methyl ester carboxylesterase
MATSAIIKRRFVKVGDRHVHYRRAGSGSPIVLIHPGIAHSAYLMPLIQRLSETYTCFAFDNPGYGNSDALPGPDVSIADIAEALAATLCVMKFPKVPVFGTHTGAAVGLELAVRHPDLVSGVYLDGVPMFTPEETRALFDNNYAPPLVIDPLGGHFANTWTRLRDQATFYPWYSRNPDDLFPVEIAAPPEAIHKSLCYFFCAAKIYAGPFLAAHTFGDIAAERMLALDVPAVIAYASNDNLIKHIDRIPPLKPVQTLVRLGSGADEKTALINRTLHSFATGAAAPPDTETLPARLGIDRQFIDLPTGQVLVRSCGAPDSPAIILLHDAPGSSLTLEPLVAALGLHHRVHALDLPGCGESDALPGGAPTLSDYAQAVKAACQVLSLEEITLYGTGFGTSIAIELARDPALVIKRLVLHGALLPTQDERTDMRANYAPPIAIESTGSHWYRVWQMLRDSLVYFPWYNRTGPGLRKIAADFDGDRLHNWTFEVVKQLHAYHHVIDAALDHAAGAALRDVTAPTLVLRDPSHPFARYDAQLPALIRSGTHEDLPRDVFAQAAAIRRFLSPESL